MANESGTTYGLTILSPILEDSRLDICHSMELRWYLSNLPRDHESPFAQISSTYLARLVVMDDVVFVGHPACEEHLKSRYLVFETNFDGDEAIRKGRVVALRGISGRRRRRGIHQVHEELPAQDDVLLRGCERPDGGIDAQGATHAIGAGALHGDAPGAAARRLAGRVRAIPGQAVQNAAAQAGR